MEKIEKIDYCTAADIKRELRQFSKACMWVTGHLMVDAEQAPEDEDLSEQLKIITGKSFSEAVRSLIENQSLTAACAVRANAEELGETFSDLEDPSIRSWIRNVKQVSSQIAYILEK